MTFLLNLRWILMNLRFFLLLLPTVWRRRKVCCLKETSSGCKIRRKACSLKFSQIDVWLVVQKSKEESATLCCMPQSGARSRLARRNAAATRRPTPCSSMTSPSAADEAMSVHLKSILEQSRLKSTTTDSLNDSTWAILESQTIFVQASTKCK